MCGIAGFIDKHEHVEAAVVERMVEKLRHRGPDDGNAIADRHVGLGHRRLSILDLTTAGRQPMESSDGRFALIFNGEIYNFRELRNELTQLNCQFHSHTDTEVVLNALITWGPDCISRFNGMFALAFYDRKDQRVVVARDRLGIKPLYFYSKDGKFLFGSEMRALFATGIPSKQLSYRALAEYLTFQNVFDEESFAAEIKVFQPATYCILEESTGWTPRFRKFWRPMFSPNYARSFQEAKEHFADIFKRVIERQMISDVTVGSYLSGGLDSGAINAACVRNNPKFQSITVGFEMDNVEAGDRRFNELHKARAIAQKLKTHHFTKTIGPHDVLTALVPLSQLLEEPRVGQSYPNYFAAQLAAKHVKVVMTGTGGDELFGGYTWRYLLEEPIKSVSEMSARAFAIWNRAVPVEILRKAARSPLLKNEADIMRESFSTLFQSCDTGSEEIRDTIFAFEIKTFLHSLLMVDDKINMHFSIESRVPLLDNELIDFALTVPIEQKCDLQQGGKIIFRAMLQEFYPELGLSDDKLGFSAPDASWFRNQLREQIAKITLHPEHPLFELVERNWIEKLVSEHFSGEQNRRGLIWSLLTLNSTLKQFDF